MLSLGFHDIIYASRGAGKTLLARAIASKHRCKLLKGEFLLHVPTLLSMFFFWVIFANDIL